MFKKMSKKIAIALGLLLGSAGIAFAAFNLIFTVGNNSVTAGNATLTINATPINTSGLVAGGSTSPAALVIKNTGAYPGAVALKISGLNGPLCADLSLHVDGDKTGDLDPLVAGSIALGTLNPGETLNLTRTVSLKAGSTALGTNCLYSEQATFVN